MNDRSFSHFIAVCEGMLAPDKAPAAERPRFNATGRTNAERKRLKVDPVPVRPLGSVVHQVVPGHLIPRNLSPSDLPTGGPIPRPA